MTIKASCFTCVTCTRTLASRAAPYEIHGHKEHRCHACWDSWLKSKLETNSTDSIRCPTCLQYLTKAEVWTFSSNDLRQLYREKQLREAKETSKHQHHLDGEVDLRDLGTHPVPALVSKTDAPTAPARRPLEGLMPATAPPTQPAARVAVNHNETSDENLDTASTAVQRLTHFRHDPIKPTLYHNKTSNDHCKAVSIDGQAPSSPPIDIHSEKNISPETAISPEMTELEFICKLLPYAGRIVLAAFTVPIFVPFVEAIPACFSSS